jgi:hypothetical protein
VSPELDGPVTVLSRHWKDGQRELAYVTRSIAAAVSRSVPVTVLIPGAPAVSEADGAFDLTAVGHGPGGSWPSASDLHLPSPAAQAAAVIVDDLTDDARPVLAALGSTARLFTIESADRQPNGVPATSLSMLQRDHSTGTRFVGLHVPVNPLAAVHRHNGFGFVGYVLVLSGRWGRYDQPPDEVAWVTAAFHSTNIVVVEDAQASLWRGRALRGTTSVDSRTDLWRLVAHARVCIDVAPGAVISRECVEALRFGTPIIVPADSPVAAAHAAVGGLTYGNMSDLLHRVRECQDDTRRAELSVAGKSYADECYGDPEVFVERVRLALAT